MHGGKDIAYANASLLGIVSAGSSVFNIVALCRRKNTALKFVFYNYNIVQTDNHGPYRVQ